ncbi:LA_2272/LA_2273 family lipoprotein [Leptospira kmetyi]|uniref:LA_2272/LA_2273 family lipoprotein n=1 Tax=Leptospira kmetyi TaxID=408139 RepID=UPI00197B9A12|nr:hypothetical protein [Leptospira kmetyi]
MKLTQKFILYGFIIFVHSAILCCGVALTTKTTAKLPSDTNTEVLRLNLIYGESKNIYGLNLGIANSVQNDLIGLQIGIVNGAENATGIQIGAINNSRPSFALLKIGIFNLNFFLESGRRQPRDNPESIERRIKGDAGFSVGLVNLASGRLNLGLFNYGYGWNAGLINWNGEDSGVSIGIVNIGEKENFQIGILNFCKEGLFPVMILVNYCSSSPNKNSDKNQNIRSEL